ncbi:MAG: NAD+ synthase [Rhodothermales bacterium]|nr:NAD+ synthase [Rhodothermales bacterium]
MKIALAQINPTVGDLRGNGLKIIDYAQRAAAQGADLVVFPEMCIVGYPPQDLLENPFFLDAARQTMEWVASEVPSGVGVIIGAPVPNPSPVGKRVFNAAFLYEGGQRVAEVRKTLLPTYDVFDEYRHFEPAAACRPVEWRGWRLGLHICEDMWNNQENAPFYLYRRNPVDELAAQGVDLFINISASPFSIGKHAVRNRLVAEACREHGVPFVLVNQVGANTEIIFDGDSRVHAADGTRLCCAPSFEEHLMVWDTGEDTGPCPLEHDDAEDLHDALALGIRDYFRKTGAFTKAVVGLSGGIDSAVTCALAVAALGPEHVVGVTMPSEYSSAGSVDDSRALAENLGIAFHTIPIAPAVDAFGQMLAEAFAGTEEGVAEENIQARARGVTLMALSNKFGYLLLSTGNKSEMAVGYATLYGDMSGGLAVLSDVLKTRVYALARHINARAGQAVIPENTITKPPSAELRPGQQDQDTLPPYDVLDEILRRYIEELEELDAIVAATGYDRALVHDLLRRVDRNEYKRRQAPPGLRVSMKAFGLGRRLPIVMRWDRDDAAEMRAERAVAEED